MSQWKLPNIDSKKHLVDQEDFSFVNKDKKKPKQQSGALSMVEDLRRKVDQQKKQIENRNSTIMGLQRNFESLSGIVKHQKTQSAILKAELEKFRQNSGYGDKKITEFHEKYSLVCNQNKMLKQEISFVKKMHSECHKATLQCQVYKSKINELEAVIEKLSTKLDLINQEKKQLQGDLNRIKEQDKNKRQLQQRVVDLEDELKKANDSNNVLNDRLKLQQDRIKSMKLGSVGFEANINELNNKLKQEHKKKSSMEYENEKLRKQLENLTKDNDTMKKNMDSIDVYSKIRQQNQHKAKQEILMFKQTIQKHNQQLFLIKKQTQRKSDIIQGNAKEIELLRKQVQTMQEKEKNNENKFNGQITRLTNLAGQLNRQLDNSRSETQSINGLVKQQRKLRTDLQIKAQRLDKQIGKLVQRLQAQEKYSRYFSQIDVNQTKGVIITNSVDIERIKNNETSLSVKMSTILEENKNIIDQLKRDNIAIKKQKTSLENEVNSKTKEVHDNLKLVKELTEELQQFRREEKKLAETIAEEKRKSKQYEKQKTISEKLIEAQKQKSLAFEAKLKQYENEEQKLKKLMAKQQQQIRVLSKDKEQQIKRLIYEKEQEIEKQRKNNKILWSDNKKLKQIQQQIRSQADLQLQQLQSRKRQEMQRIKRDLQKKYGEQQKQQQSNNNQLKKILQQKAQQIKTITENHNRTKSQLDFYKNRNKELEGVVNRCEKNFKDQLSALQKELKTNKQIIAVLDKKNDEANLEKQQIESKQKNEIERLTNQIASLKKSSKTKGLNKRLLQQKSPCLNLILL